jgi:hypothetical protein
MKQDSRNRQKNIAVEALFENYKKRKTEIQGLLKPVQANLGYFLAWFQSHRLESPLASKPYVSFKVCTPL